MESRTDFDAIVIGGSFAGLSTAMQLARARRSVVVIDAGQPRNRFAEHSHGFFGQDGSEPQAMIAQAREQVLAYPTVRFVQDEAIAVHREGDEHFSVALASGETRTGARLLLAHGVQDVLPEIPGVRERWGKTVAHCPYCHGYEVAGKQLGVLRTKPGSFHHAQLINEWGPVTYFLNGENDLDPADRADLERRGITIEPTPIAGLLGDAPGLDGVRLRDGRFIELDALFLAPDITLGGLHEQLECAIDESPNGPVIRTDQFKQTTTPNVYAAGDLATPMWNITLASADGVVAGAAMHRSLVFG